ncbi:MAG: DNA mismatch repair endonuclease MutL [Candidatus Kapabacteria bacterium]|nr:DNA mismatch repair endonuclease MutL [Ignavibacteriota bacterium]MCW5885160.1 DNA mismatch repair endonuclease MutL [Candidatus Kapabacteria bacterium]
MSEITENIIKLLPDFIANQIAAGEVVQKPESVVKELIENSLDAGADTIILSVKNAGKSLIHVIDNGNGMSEKDLRLSVKRHATSKVFSSEDLEEIKTYGFRGEALASVCSVANVEIRTKRHDDKHGWRLIAEPMKDELIEEFNCDKGTQIFVRNLFYNVPARRKFLKSNLTEFRYISDTMIKIAIARPEVRFTFYDDDTLIFDVRKSDLKQRIIELLGQSVKTSLIPVEYQNDFIKINGFVGEPHLARQSRSGQFFFLNGRSILSNSLAHAVYSCYEELLDKNQKPLFILNIGIDYSKVDVNVHPQKHEVKFDDERFVYNSIKSAILGALSSYSMIPEINIDIQNAANPFTTVHSGKDKIVVNKMTGEIINNFNYDNSNQNFSGTGDISRFKPNRSAFDDIFGKTSDYSNDLLIPADIESHNYKYIGSRFIVIEINDYLVIMDQSGLQQRILYDRALSQKISGNSSVQDILFPIDIEISEGQKQILTKAISEIESIGFRYEISGNEVVFSGIPNTIRQGKEEESLRKFLNELSTIEIDLIGDLFDKICTFYSEAVSVKNGSDLMEVEIRDLMKSLKNYKIPIFSPRGKKSVIKLTSQEFYNKLFFSS